MSIQITNNKQTFCILSLYTFVLLFLISPDSFTHDIYTCCDTPIFFMCGKAWMNGMIPYVDFTDSKGPLLWLIQGIGYLISPYNYIGVFLLSCVFYCVVFFLAFKTAFLFLKNYHLAIICSMLMGLVYFNPWYHYEIKSEDWCQPFVILALYRLCLQYYKTDIKDRRSLYITAYLLGLSCAGTLLIKYSITAMMAIMVFSFYYYIVKEKQNLIIPTLLMIVGALTLIIPFVAYFYFLGNLRDFINEYFIKTLATIDGSNNFVTFIHELLLTSADTRYALLFTISLLGCIMFAKQNRNYRLFPFISMLFFWIISIHHATNYYYLTSCFSFLIFFMIWVVNINYTKLISISKRGLISMSFILIVFLTYWNYTFTDGYLLSNLFFYNNEYRTTYYNAAFVLSQVKNPKIVYLDCAIYGWGTPVNALPGSKYYNTQYGETKEMRNRKHQDVLQQIPDFICMEEDFLYEDAMEVVKNAGYKLCYDFHWWHHHFYFYTKHKGIKVPTQNIHVSNLDVLFKRRIFK